MKQETIEYKKMSDQVDLSTAYRVQDDFSGYWFSREKSPIKVDKDKFRIEIIKTTDRNKHIPYGLGSTVFSKQDGSSMMLPEAMDMIQEHFNNQTVDVDEAQYDEFWSDVMYDPTFQHICHLLGFYNAILEESNIIVKTQRNQIYRIWWGKAEITKRKS